MMNASTLATAAANITAPASERGDRPTARAIRRSSSCAGMMLASARAAFAALAPELRATASLVILNGLSYREAAETLDVPIGTIMSRVSRSRRALEDALGANAPAEAAR